MIWVKTAILCCVAIWSAGSAIATEPLSAIPWLSENPKDPKRPTPRRSGATSSADAPIEITAIAPLEKEGVGILPPSTTGLPRNLWNGLSELRVRKLISDLPNTGVPTSRELFTRLLLAQTLPPAGSAGGDTLLIARIDRLIKAGRLAEADALARASGSTSPELFARTFDIGLLNNEIDVVCKTLLSQPEQPNLAAQRIYCLGTSGQWRAAETALKSSTELSPAIAELLAGFLDPDSFEDAKPPSGEPVQSALEFKIRDAIALPRRTTRPPLAFHYADLSGRAGLRQRILAAEALVSAGALPSSVLFSAYRDSAPAASGGAWDRAAAVQDLDQGIAIGKWEQELITAHARMRRLSLLPALADTYASALAGAPAPRSKGASEVRGLFLALGSTYQDPEGHNWPTRIAEAHHLANQSLGLQASPRAKAAAAGLAGKLPATEPANRMRELIEVQKIGAALLRALNLLSAGTRIDPDDLQIALYAISASGLPQDALKIGVETLVLGNRQ